MGIIGIFFIQTAITAQPEKTKGLDGALSEIASQSYGQILLALVAIGLTLYGVFQIIKGKNRNMVL
ncbi:DUF1206 domain-containing protein [Bacillus coahuilensis]|uniref:DUF1206 domain-containing protein n=1 Tax=Bacillus coahuilensis TaxID=408580 RepID=UPI0002EB16E5|nr:DUF1206 domain-containing protein [Bacillus coahuilensis]